MKSQRLLRKVLAMSLYSLDIVELPVDAEMVGSISQGAGTVTE